MIRHYFVLVLFLLFASGCTEQPQRQIADLSERENWLPTGVVLDPAGPTFDIGPLPLNMRVSPEGDRAVMLLSGWRMQGIQVVDPVSQDVVQTLEQDAAFVGLAFSADGSTLYASGGNQDVVYLYDWSNGTASLQDSLILAEKEPGAPGTRYPAGLALSPDGTHLYVAENLGDQLAVIDLTSGAVVQRLDTGRYPYEIEVHDDGRVFVSIWNYDHLLVFEPDGANRLQDQAVLVPVARRPSAMTMNEAGTRLYAVSASTDRITVLDTESLEVIALLEDPAPEGPHEGSTPNALLLSGDETRLYVAEADNNAIAVFDLSAETSGISSATGDDSLIGRIPVGWYPTAMVRVNGALVVANGKGRGTSANAETGHRFGQPRNPDGYPLGQISGTITLLDDIENTDLSPLTDRVAAANNWDIEREAPVFPPFEHVIYIIKENRTYDQVFGDMPEGDGDSSLVYFPRPVTPNHHALADRFGLYDRFFVNAEASPDGHNWSMAAYTTDYLQKTVPSLYSGRGRTYDYEGMNRFRYDTTPPDPDEFDDVAEPAMGYLWDLAQRKGITFRNFGEFVIPEYVDEDADMPTGYKGNKPFLEANTDPDFPGYNLSIPDVQRAEVWIEALNSYIEADEMPQFQILRIPNDHTAGGRAGALTPRAYMADNDLAVGMIVEALSNSPFWATSIVFIVEDDSQNGPDHVDSHRAPFLVVSPYNRPGVVSRFVNTTDALATMEGILGLDALSQFDYYGRPLVDVFSEEPDLTPYTALIPDVPMDERNPEEGLAAELSEELDFDFEDIANEDLFNRVLWMTIKGEDRPYPGVRRASMLEMNMQSTTLRFSP